MTALELQPIQAVPVDHALPLIRSARAEVARLTLESRRVAAQVDAVTADGRTDSVVLLETSLRDQTDDLRHELADEMSREKSAAEHMRAEARAEAEEILAAARDAATRETAAREAAAQSEPSTQNVVPLRPQAVYAPVVADSSLPAWEPESPPPEPDPVPEESVGTEPAPGVGDDESAAGHDLETATMARFEDLMRRAVADGVRHALVATGSAGAFGDMHAASAVPVTATHLVAPAAGYAPPQPSVRQRFLHLDVILPLLAAVVVVVILFAWVG